MILTATAALSFQAPSQSYLFYSLVKVRGWMHWIDHLTRRRIIPSLVGMDVGSWFAKDVLNYVAGLLEEPLPGLTIAVLLLRLRQPRPSWRKLAMQPGIVGCAAAILGFLIFLEANYLLGSQIKADSSIGATVSTAWILLAVGRRWAAEPNWIDRLGRVVGFAWIAVALGKILERSI